MSWLVKKNERQTVKRHWTLKLIFNYRALPSTNWILHLLTTNLLSPDADNTILSMVPIKVKYMKWCKSFDNFFSSLQHAVVFVNGDQYYGAEASLNVWAPRVTNDYEFSLSQIWVISGSFGNDLNTIEAGWQACPWIFSTYSEFLYWEVLIFHWYPERKISVVHLLWHVILSSK